MITTITTRTRTLWCTTRPRDRRVLRARERPSPSTPPRPMHRTTDLGGPGPRRAHTGLVPILGGLAPPASRPASSTARPRVSPSGRLVAPPDLVPSRAPIGRRGRPDPMARVLGRVVRPDPMARVRDPIAPLDRTSPGHGPGVRASRASRARSRGVHRGRASLERSRASPGRLLRRRRLRRLPLDREDRASRARSQQAQPSPRPRLVLRRRMASPVAADGEHLEHRPVG